MNSLKSAVFCSDSDNDLISALRQSSYEPVVADDITAALEMVPDGGVVFMLANSYPSIGTELTYEVLNCARERNVKLFIEYPQAILGNGTGEPRTIVYERLVASDGLFGSMENGSILMINGCWYRDCLSGGPGLLCLAKVAGFDRMAYELPEKYVTVLDWLDDKHDVLISAACLSSFITGRYGPVARWRVLWETLFRELGLGNISLSWKPTVAIESDRESPLAQNALRSAWSRNVDWAHKYMLVKTGQSVSVFEGFRSSIDYDGRQSLINCIRGDCMGELAMELVFGWKQLGNPALKLECEQIVDRVLTPGVFYHNDPASSMYGLNNWFENAEIFYGDDNARMLLGALCVRSLTGEKRWDERLLRCTFANLRTSDQNGLRRSCLNSGSFRDKDWSFYYNENVSLVSPHYQAYLWAEFLWIYALTGIEELLTKSEKAVAIVMERFPDKLNWQNSMTGEISRMLLPLSFLVRVHPTDQNRKWLKQAVDAMIEYQVDCGAIRDAFGEMSLGHYPPPRSNDNYGTTEASLIQQNGDPVTDLLYTTNWALIGFWEASLVMKEKYVREAYEKLRDFMLRIQVRSEIHPELDGTWMRGFDYDKWEYWGSSADIGWSVWCVESGWVNAWITTTLILEERNESLMNLSAKDDLSADAEKIYLEMMTVSPTVEKEAATQAKMEGSAE